MSRCTAHIVIDGQRDSFVAGETIRGQVVLRCSAPVTTHATGAWLEHPDQGQVQWRTVQQGELSAGEHRFPFTFKAPQALSIQWEIRAEADVIGPGAANARAAITIAPKPVDVTAIQWGDPLPWAQPRWKKKYIRLALISLVIPLFLGLATTDWAVEHLPEIAVLGGVVGSFWLVMILAMLLAERRDAKGNLVESEDLYSWSPTILAEPRLVSGPRPQLELELKRSVDAAAAKVRVTFFGRTTPTRTLAAFLPKHRSHLFEHIQVAELTPLPAGAEGSPYREAHAPASASPAVRFAFPPSEHYPRTLPRLPQVQWGLALELLDRKGRLQERSVWSLEVTVEESAAKPNA